MEKPVFLAYDTETTGLSPHRNGAKMFACSTCSEVGCTNVYRLQDYEGRGGLRWLVQEFERGNYTPVMHNSKFDLSFTENFLGRPLQEDLEFHDTIIMSHLMQSNHPSHRLKDLGLELAGIPKDDEEEVEVFAGSGDDVDYSRVPVEIMEKYQRRDAERTMLLFLLWWPMIQADPKLLATYQAELALVRTTMRMEARGIMLNRSKCVALRDDLNDRSERCIANIARIVGERVNISKPDNLRWLLYEYLRLPVLRLTPKSKQPAVDMDTLAEVIKAGGRHPILDLVKQWSSWTHGTRTMRTYLDCVGEDDIIHPSIRTCGAATGRESCSDPNLQNVEKSTEESNREYAVPARSVFRPRPGYVHFHIDYSGQEFRIAVHYSGDKELTRLLRRGMDPHVEAAIMFYAKSWEIGSPQERKAMRTAAKHTNFAIIYGAGIAKCALVLGISLEQAARGFAEYARRWPGLLELNNTVANSVRECGWVTTVFGNRIYVPVDKAYIGVNYLVQGTGGGVLKRAQVRIDHILRRETKDAARLLLPIHDELIVEWPRRLLPEARRILRMAEKEITDFPEITVPLPVEVEVATVDWSQKKEYKLCA